MKKLKLRVIWLTSCSSKRYSSIRNQLSDSKDFILYPLSLSYLSGVTQVSGEKKRSCYRITEHLRPKTTQDPWLCLEKSGPRPRTDYRVNTRSVCKVCSSAAPSAVQLLSWPQRETVSRHLRYPYLPGAHMLFLRQGKKCCLSPFP